MNQRILQPFALASTKRMAISYSLTAAEGTKPAISATKRVSDGVLWGGFPTSVSSVTTNASQWWNVLAESFTPAALKGFIFPSGTVMVAQNRGELFGEQLSVLDNCMKNKFSSGDTAFHYKLPAASLAPKITKPSGIKGRSEALELRDWKNGAAI